MALVLLSEVRSTTARVTKEASLVRIDPAGLAAFAARLDPGAIRAAYRWESDFHFRGAERQLIDYVFTVDAVNFGSGFSPDWKARRTGSTYTSVAAALKRRLEQGRELGPRFAAAASRADVAEILGIEPEFELVGMYARALNEIGSWVERRFGSYAALLESLPEQGRAAALVSLLACNLSCFDDRCELAGREVHFYKRAQIVANDLSLALSAEGLGRFGDLERLTMFADNLVPHVLRVEGALSYDPAFLESIEAKQLVQPGSREEIEIRAAGVQGVEKLVDLLRARGVEGIFPAMLDVYLWNLGQEPRYKSHPRHLCKTYFY